MIIYLTILPAILLIVNGVNSANLLKITRVQREVEKVLPPFYSNHPPSIESYIPVTVIYDEEEDIHVLNNHKEQLKSTTNGDIVHTSSSEGSVNSVTQNVLTPEELYVNHTPVVGKNEPTSVATVNTEKETGVTSVLKNDMHKSSVDLNQVAEINKGRSLNLETLDSKNDQNATKSRSNVRKQTQRRRVYSVDKVTNNKIQVANDSKTNKATEKVVMKQVSLSKNNNTYQSARIIMFPRRTQQKDPVVPIVDSENYVFAFSGDYHYSYEGGDGTKAYERGELRTIDDGSSGAGVVGGYSYTDKDGVDFSLSYTADENGYRPIGAHLPTPPPIPPAIQRALDYLATKTTPEPVTERVKSS